MSCPVHVGNSGKTCCWHPAKYSVAFVVRGSNSWETTWQASREIKLFLGKLEVIIWIANCWRTHPQYLLRCWGGGGGGVRGWEGERQEAEEREGGFHRSCHSDKFQSHHHLCLHFLPFIAVFQNHLLVTSPSDLDCLYAKVEYLIKWRGFDDPKEDTWEPLGEISLFGFQPPIHIGHLWYFQGV